MAIEYGCPLELLLNSRSRINDIQRHIEQLDKEFALVIIVEHSDEFIILLRRILKWSTKEINYIRKMQILTKLTKKSILARKIELDIDSYLNLICFAVLVFTTTAPVIYIAFRTFEKLEIPIRLDVLQQEVRHIAFLKVHKAASTTIQNMLLRFGTERNLTYVIPSVNSIYPNVISLLETVTSNNIRPIPLLSTHFDILCLHVLYNRTAFGQILPNDTVYIGTLRDPFEYFISMMLYFPIMFERFNISGPRAITDFLEIKRNTMCL
ncbi:unnamed protein product [Mytilus coruscus]|uniref:Uncharacterized protein n=1 Tax=Mytilus coruscus TaxID=42192 RepID=A0A6J8APW9_MYTCO|nr:unnamed protein product [Mytilus coruscus]